MCENKVCSVHGPGWSPCGNQSGSYEYQDQLNLLKSDPPWTLPVGGPAANLKSGSTWDFWHPWGGGGPGGWYEIVCVKRSIRHWSKVEIFISMIKMAHQRKTYKRSW